MIDKSIHLAIPSRNNNGIIYKNRH